MAITVKLELPDDLAKVLGAPGRDLSRTALEALAVEEYRAGRLTDQQFRHLLGISRFEADGVLKAHGVWLDYSLEDLDREGEVIRRLGRPVGE
jgi:hypothetical protein